MSQIGICFFLQLIRKKYNVEISRFNFDDETIHIQSIESIKHNFVISNHNLNDRGSSKLFGWFSGWITALDSFKIWCSTKIRIEKTNTHTYRSSEWKLFWSYWKKWSNLLIYVYLKWIFYLNLMMMTNRITNWQITFEVFVCSKYRNKYIIVIAPDFEKFYVYFFLFGSKTCTNRLNHNISAWEFSLFGKLWTIFYY